MHHYTVIVSLSDHTAGIEQYEPQSPKEAISKFIDRAKSHQPYDDALARLIGGGDGINLIHVANDLCGFWIWTPIYTDDSRTESILGGYVIQTDRGAPKRGEGA